MTLVTRYPTTNNPLSGTWNNRPNAGADDGAVVDITRGTVKNSQDDCEFAGYDFDSVIPAGATINQVDIEIEHRVASGANICFLENFASVGANDGAVNSDALEPTVLTARVYSAYARPGGGGWTRADLLDANFKTTLRARNGNNNSSNTWEWDYIRVVVDYTSGAPQTVTPSPVTAVLSAVTPLVVLGMLTVSPTPVTASGTTTVPAVQLGAVNLTPSPASAAWSASQPTLVLGTVTLAPAAVTAAWSIPPPSLGGEQALTPDAVPGVCSVPAPNVQIGTLIILPTPMAAAWSLASPTLTAGPVTVAPAAVVGTWTAPSPTVAFGPLTLVPGAVAGLWSIPSPTVTIGTRTLTVNPVTAAWSLALPIVEGGETASVGKIAMIGLGLRTGL